MSGLTLELVLRTRKEGTIRGSHRLDCDRWFSRSITVELGTQASDLLTKLNRVNVYMGTDAGRELMAKVVGHDLVDASIVRLRLHLFLADRGYTNTLERLVELGGWNPCSPQRL